MGTKGWFALEGGWIIPFLFPATTIMAERGIMDAQVEGGGTRMS